MFAHRNSLLGAWGAWPFWRVLQRLTVLTLAIPWVVVVSLLSVPSSWVHVLNVTACFKVTTVVVIKHYDQKHLGRKGFIVLMLSYHMSSSKEVMTGTQAWQEPGGRSWCRGRGGMLLTGLLPMACSACFLMESRTTNPGVAPPTMGWDLLHGSPFKKMPSDRSCGGRSQLRLPPLW